MDLLTHAAVGAVTGGTLGHPIAGAVIAAAPDLVLGIKRRVAPTFAYRCTHSALGVLGAAVLAWACAGELWAEIAFWCLASHIYLDAFTHGTVWGTRVLFPFSDAHIRWAEEWEWFNDTWFLGLWLAFVWSALFWMLNQ